MNDLQPIVQEMFKRSVAGVFALREGEDLIVQPRPETRWMLNAGLAARLQHAPIRPVMRPRRERDVRTIDDLTGPYDPLDPEQYEMATTDHLLAEFYRHGAELDWVLGLYRPRKFRGHWSGLCWNGSALVCSGLAACLVAYITEGVLQARDGQRPGGHGLPEDLKGLFGPAIRNASAQCPSRTYMAGLSQVATVHAGTYGDDGHPGSDLAGFVQID